MIFWRGNETILFTEQLKVDNESESNKARLLKVSGDWSLEPELDVKSVPNPISNKTFGDIGVATAVKGPAQFQTTVLNPAFRRYRYLEVICISGPVFKWDSNSTYI